MSKSLFDRLPTSITNDLWPAELRDVGREVNKGLRDALPPRFASASSDMRPSIGVKFSKHHLAGKWAAGTVHKDLCGLLSVMRRCVRDGVRVHIRVDVTVLTPERLSVDEEDSPGVLPEHYASSAALMGVLNQMRWLVRCSPEVCDAWLGRMVDGLRAVLAEDGQPGVGSLHQRLRGVSEVLLRCRRDHAGVLPPGAPHLLLGRVRIGHGLFLLSDLHAIDHQKHGSQYVPPRNVHEGPVNGDAYVDQALFEVIRALGSEVMIQGSLLSRQTGWFVKHHLVLMPMLTTGLVLRLHGIYQQNDRCSRPLEHSKHDEWHNVGAYPIPCAVCSLQGTREILEALCYEGRMDSVEELDVRNHGHLLVKAEPEMLETFREVRRGVIMFEHGVPYTGVCGLVAPHAVDDGDPNEYPIRSRLEGLYISVRFGRHAPGVAPSFPVSLRNLAIGIHFSRALGRRDHPEPDVLLCVRDMLGPVLSGTLQALVLFGLGTAPDPGAGVQWGDLGGGREWSIQEDVDHNDVLSAPLQEGDSWQNRNRRGFRITWAAPLG